MTLNFPQAVLPPPPCRTHGGNGAPALANDTGTPNKRQRKGARARTGRHGSSAAPCLANGAGTTILNTPTERPELVAGLAL